jgi:CDP-glycerol glycerophosphotransferase (TagB/SpsB family)
VKRYLLFVSEPYALAILRPLQAAIRARGDQARWFFSGRGAHFLADDEVELPDIQAVIDYQPDVVLVPGNWVPSFIPGLKVEIFHGFSVGKRSKQKGHFRIRGYFDLYCTQGPDTTKGFLELQDRHGYFRVRETGWPKMDPLFDAGTPPWPVKRDRPVVMFASTFTPALSAAPHLHDTIAELAAGGRWRWLVTLHPKMDPAVVESYRALAGEFLEFVDTDNIIRMYKAADVLLCDTSSVISEFLLQQKPVVTFRNRRPKPYMLDVSEADQIPDALATALQRPPELIRRVTDYADHIHPYRDGKSSERVLDAVEECLRLGRDGLKRKPLNLWRRLQMRSRFGYWGL